eukprot:1260844-Amphidinium_carterae.1
MCSSATDNLWTEIRKELVYVFRLDASTLMIGISSRTKHYMNPLFVLQKQAFNPAPQKRHPKRGLERPTCDPRAKRRNSWGRLEVGSGCWFGWVVLQFGANVEAAGGKSAAEWTLLTNPVQFFLYIEGHGRPGTPVWDAVEQNGGWDIFPTSMELCTNHDFSAFTTGLGAQFGWGPLFATHEQAMQLIIEGWALCPEGCTRTGSCTQAELEEWALMGAAYGCTYRQFYGYPSIYPNLIKPETGFAEPTHLTCRDVSGALSAQE